MGIHHRHAHGRVLRGLEAREHLEIKKRDSHGSDIRLHVPADFEEKSNVQTALSVVYVTMPQTFSGAAVYVTITGDPTSAAAASATASASDEESSASSAKAGSSASSTKISTSLATVTPQSSAESAMTTFATASAVVAAGQATALAGSPVQATRSATATSGAISQGSSGMSGGASAGLAIGIILAIALAAGLVYFCWRRKKAQTHEEINDEKHASFVDAGARQFEAAGGAHKFAAASAPRDSTATEKVPASLRSSRTASTAPRLSLRPVTQFLPNLSENRKSSANSLANALFVSEKPKSAWERQPSQAGQNPFDDAPAMSEKQSNPFEEGDGKKSTESLPAAAANSSPKSSWEGSEPPTPKSAKFGTAAAVPVAAGAAAARDVSPPKGPNNVHRVQLDFKPSMDDELELKSGQLVRMLHEYDDGWALCIRMDRSQQGVAPRTCLSKMPVRPRPQGPPGSRPGPPPQGARRPSNGSPPHAPALNGPMFPRPLTPSGSSQSSSPTSSNNGDASAPTAVPARKPVPGQAM